RAVEPNLFGQPKIRGLGLQCLGQIAATDDAGLPAHICRKQREGVQKMRDALFPDQRSYIKNSQPVGCRRGRRWRIQRLANDAAADQTQLVGRKPGQSGQPANVIGAYGPDERGFSRLFGQKRLRYENVVGMGRKAEFCSRKPGCDQCGIRGVAGKFRVNMLDSVRSAPSAKRDRLGKQSRHRKPAPGLAPVCHGYLCDKPRHEAGPAQGFGQKRREGPAAEKGKSEGPRQQFVDEAVHDLCLSEGFYVKDPGIMAKPAIFDHIAIGEGLGEFRKFADNDKDSHFRASS
ncbi:MAG: hypothetical protein NZ734_05890, partial [Paracoccus sp.]|nr:hypothetical protein [Paracoccus sp. (in: a-proteobacteria)]